MASRPPPSPQPVRVRRGAASVEKAILDRGIAELAEVGLGRLTFESIAERAGTGKEPLSGVANTTSSSSTLWATYVGILPDTGEQEFFVTI